ncbi:MAG: DUF433 domain-containing protein [Acidobacteriota bacterium]
MVDGTTVTVGAVWRRITEGRTDTEIQAEYPELTLAGITAVRQAQEMIFPTGGNVKAIDVKWDADRGRQVVKEWGWSRRSDPPVLELSITAINAMPTRVQARVVLRRLSSSSLTVELLDERDEVEQKPLQLSTPDFGQRDFAIVTASLPPRGYRNVALFEWPHDGLRWTLAEPGEAGVSLRELFPDATHFVVS